MKRYKLLSILMVCIIVMSACSTGSRGSHDKELPKEDHAKEITIEVEEYGTNFYANAAKKFEKETGVKVNVINNIKMGQSNEELMESSTKNTDRIQAELMAGKGADLYAGIYLDFDKIGKNKHLCNLANWTAKEPIFSNDAYYMNVLKSGFENGDAYSLPLFIGFYALGSTIEVPELEGKSLNWEKFFALTKGLKRNGVLYGLTDQLLFDRRFQDRYDHFVNEKEKTQTLNSQDMIKLLEQCKEWSTEGLCIPCDAENFTDLWSKAFFQETGGGDMDMLVNFRFNNPYLKDEPYIYDIPSDTDKNDKSNKVMPTDLICINAASPYKATAWKFVKFLLREDVQATGHYTPVNRKAADKHVKKNLEETISYYNLKVDENKIIKESEAILNNANHISSNIYPSDIDNIVLEEAKRFFKSEITAEAAAKNMADRAGLYFKEE